MNVLFVNYGGIRTNSIEHIHGFSQALKNRGHDCRVAIPGKISRAEAGPYRDMHFVSHTALAQVRPVFGYGRAPDIIHAWTPREAVRKTVLPVLARYTDARLIVHLEDNEEWITEHVMQAPLERLRLLSEGLLQYLTPGHCMNPLLGPQWLKQADGVTVITPALREFVADDIPTHVLRPGVAFDEFHPDEPSSSLRDAVSLEKEERLVFYPGGVNRLNRGDLLDLYRAIQMINDKGILCRLIQCGPHTRAFLHQVDPRLSRHVTVLGYIDRSYIPRWLATADVLIQPGHDDRFNRYRLPSKIPQFLATGVPSILPRTNIGLELEDHREALLLKSGEPDEIAEQCLRVFDRDPALAGMREASVSFAQRHFDLARNTEKLLGFYRQVLSASRTPKTPVAEPRRVSRWLDPWWYRYLCYRLQRKPGR